MVNGGGPDDSPRTNSNINVIASLDESTYNEQDGAPGDDDHPIAWYQEFDGGRSWYTGGGHTDASFSEPLFRLHLLGGIQYAAGQAADACTPPAPTDAYFEQVTLAKGVDKVGEPMSIAVLPDGACSTTPATAASSSPTSRATPRCSPTSRSTPTTRTACRAWPSARPSRRTGGCTCTTRHP